MYDRSDKTRNNQIQTVCEEPKYGKPIANAVYVFPFSDLKGTFNKSTSFDSAEGKDKGKVQSTFHNKYMGISIVL